MLVHREANARLVKLFRIVTSISVDHIRIGKNIPFKIY
jgi:hypothetical protein